MTRKTPHSSPRNEPRARAAAPKPRARRPGASAKKGAKNAKSAGDDSASARATGSAGNGGHGTQHADSDPIPEYPLPADEKGPRVIRRYANRRLYDARLSRCVTMEEIGGFVRAGEDVRVIDADSEADITKRVLVQLILEEHNHAQLELLPVGLLRSLLSTRSESLSGWLEQYLATGAEWLDRAARQAAPLTSTWNWPFMGGFPGFGGFGASGPNMPPGGAGGMPPAPSPTGSAHSPATDVEQPHKKAVRPSAAQPPATPPAGARKTRGGAAAVAATAENEADLKRRVDELSRQLADLSTRFKRR